MDSSDGDAASRESRVGRPLAQFIVSLWKLVSAPENHALVDWSEDGNSFIIKNIDAFAEHVLPKYFKHGHFSSLSRQLCFYSFRKVSKANSNNVKLVGYSHPFFIRGRPDLLPLVVRKTNETAQRALDESERLKSHYGDALPPEDVAKDLAITVSGTNALRAVEELESTLRDDAPDGSPGTESMHRMPNAGLLLTGAGAPRTLLGHRRYPDDSRSSGADSTDPDEHASIVRDDPRGYHRPMGRWGSAHLDEVVYDTGGSSANTGVSRMTATASTLSEMVYDVMPNSRVNTVRNMVRSVEPKGPVPVPPTSTARLDSLRSAATVVDEEAGAQRGGEPHTQAEAEEMIRNLRARIVAQWTRLNRAQRDLVVVAQALRSVARNQPELMRSVFIPPERVLEITEHIPEEVPAEPYAESGAMLHHAMPGNVRPAAVDASHQGGLMGAPTWLAPTPLAAPGLALTPHPNSSGSALGMHVAQQTRAPPMSRAPDSYRDGLPASGDWYRTASAASNSMVGPSSAGGIHALAQGLHDVKLGTPAGWATSAMVGHHPGAVAGMLPGAQYSMDFVTDHGAAPVTVGSVRTGRPTHRSHIPAARESSYSDDSSGSIPRAHAARLTSAARPQSAPQQWVPDDSTSFYTRMGQQSARKRSLDESSGMMPHQLGLPPDAGYGGIGAPITQAGAEVDAMKRARSCTNPAAASLAGSFVPVAAPQGQYYPAADLSRASSTLPSATGLSMGHRGDAERTNAAVAAVSAVGGQRVLGTTTTSATPSHLVLGVDMLAPPPAATQHAASGPATMDDDVWKHFGTQALMPGAPFTPLGAGQQQPLSGVPYVHPSAATGGLYTASMETTSNHDVAMAGRPAWQQEYAPTSGDGHLGWHAVPVQPLLSPSARLVVGGVENSVQSNASASHSLAVQASAGAPVASADVDEDAVSGLRPVFAHAVSHVERTRAFPQPSGPADAAVSDSRGWQSKAPPALQTDPAQWPPVVTTHTAAGKGLSPALRDAAASAPAVQEQAL